MGRGRDGRARARSPGSEGSGRAARTLLWAPRPALAALQAKGAWGEGQGPWTSEEKVGPAGIPQVQIPGGGRPRMEHGHPAGGRQAERAEPGLQGQGAGQDPTPWTSREGGGRHGGGGEGGGGWSQAAPVRLCSGGCLGAEGGGRDASPWLCAPGPGGPQEGGMKGSETREPNRKDQNRSLGASVYRSPTTPLRTKPHPSLRPVTPSCSPFPVGAPRAAASFVEVGIQPQLP